MTQSLPFRIIFRLSILIAGAPLIGFIVYEAGIFLVPYTDDADKAILAVINPDAYLPGMDQFMRALTDYTNFLILVPLISYAVAYLLYCVTLRRFKPVVTGLLAVETLVVAVMAARGGIWRNETYVSVNILLIIGILAAFGAVTALFHKMPPRRMFRFFLMFWLVFLSGDVAGIVITNKIKHSVARPRPLNDVHKPWNEHVRPIPDELLRGKNSFPSGHTSGTFGLLTPLFWYVRDRRGRAALFAWGCLQGLARVYTAAHFPFCVLMGGFLGFSIGTLIFFALGGPWIRELPEPHAAPAEQTAA